ncbi:MAG TPA: arylesterase [Sphingomonas sp.]|uniref:arylesterase n=1 Tax=Sphingomonas sp. TaxID=28214 RepID=UPI002ED87C6F
MRYGAWGWLVHLAALFLLPGAAHASPERPLIWALGDSLFAGYGLPPRDGFAPRLQAALRRAGVAAEVRNGGVSGDTAAQGRARLLWGLRGLKARPDLVMVELGANDMLRGLPPAQLESNLDRIIVELKRRGIPVLLVGMRATGNLGPDYRRRFDGIYPRVARRHDVPLYPFLGEGIAGNRALFQRDGLHPNARGVALVVARMLPVVRRALPR